MKGSRSANGPAAGDGGGGGCHEGRQRGQVEQAVDPDDAAPGDGHRPGQHVQVVVGDARLDLEPDDPAQAAALQLLLHGRQRVPLLVLLHRQVGVPGHPEPVARLDGHPGEEGAQVGGDHVLQGDGHVPVAGAHQPVEHGRDLDPGEAPGPPVGLAHHHQQVQ